MYISVKDIKNGSFNEKTGSVKKEQIFRKTEMMFVSIFVIITENGSLLLGLNLVLY